MRGPDHSVSAGLAVGLKTMPLSARMLWPSPLGRCVNVNGLDAAKAERTCGGMYGPCSINLEG